MPVVFTSALGRGDRGLADCRCRSANRSGAISQTPQVWLDNQVMERDGGAVRCNWDAVEELFADGVLDAMFGAYRAAARLARATADWAGPLPDLLPAGQRRCAGGSTPRPRRESGGGCCTRRFFDVGRARAGASGAAVGRRPTG